MLANAQLLYHGSYAAVRSIDLSQCSPQKDFGRGFYLTDDGEQARRFIPTSLKKARAIGSVTQDQRHGFVSVFRVNLDPDLTVFEFPGADAQWLRFVSSNRRAHLASRIERSLDRRLNYADVIIGKIANDTTNTVITTYLNGLYGPVGSSLAERTAIGLLLPDRLKEQYCFRTGLAVACLELVEVDRYDV